MFSLFFRQSKRDAIAIRPGRTFRQLVHNVIHRNCGKPGCHIGLNARSAFVYHHRRHVNP